MHLANIKEIAPGSWRVQIRRKGYKPFDRVFADVAAATAARDAELEKRAPVVSGADMSLRDCYELFKESDTFEGFGEKHQKKITQNWRHAIADELGDLPLSFFADASCKRRLVQWRQDRAKAPKVHGTGKYSAHALRLERASLISIMEYAVENGWLIANPVRDIRATRRKTKKTDEKAQQRKRQLPEDEGSIALAYHSKELMGDRIVEACRFFLLQRDTAARGGELNELPMACIFLDEEPPRMFLPATKDTKHLTEDGGRELPLSPFAVELIAEQMVFNAVQAGERGAAPTLLFSTWGNRVKPHGWRRYDEQGAVKMLRREEIVSAKYKAHRNRGEWVTRARERGVDSRTIMAQTGHRSEQSLRAYDSTNTFAPEVLDRLAKEAAHTQVDRHRHLAKVFGVSVEQLKAITTAIAKTKKSE